MLTNQDIPKANLTTSMASIYIRFVAEIFLNLYHPWDNN